MLILIYIHIYIYIYIYTSTNKLILYEPGRPEIGYARPGHAVRATRGVAW